PRLSLRSSSICPDRAITGPRHSPTRGLFTRLTVFFLLLGQFSVVNALDPDRPLTQYLRTFWGVRDGFPGGQVNGVSQTPDGYLWIGTHRGLLRFDEQSFEDGHPIDPALPASIHVLGLQTDDEGSLWIRQEGRLLLRYRNGHVDTFFPGSSERV